MGYDDYQRTYNPSLADPRHFSPIKRRRFGTSTTELIHLAVATAALTLALFLWFDHADDIFKFDFQHLSLFGKILLAFAVATSGFVLHELGHKFTAQHFGHWSEFRASPVGLILAVGTAYIFGFLIALPGATWHTASERRENGKVSAVGPLINIIVMVIAFPFTMSTSTTTTLQGNIAVAVLFFNGILAIFNLLPFGPLDGKKVLAWNPFFYIVLLGLAIGTFVLTGALFKF
jgi:Zn-dependent protease